MYMSVVNLLERSLIIGPLKTNIYCLEIYDYSGTLLSHLKLSEFEDQDSDSDSCKHNSIIL